MSRLITPSPVRRSGSMRTPAYLIAIASCLVLSWLFASRENWLGVVLVMVAAVAYAVQLVKIARTDRKASADAARGPRASTSAEQEQLKTELTEMRTAYERNRRVMLLITVIIAGLATLAWPWNQPLALALLIFTIPTLVMVWRSTIAIRKIDNGLSSAH